MFKRIAPFVNINNGVLVIALLVTFSWAWGTVEAIQKNFVLQQKVDGLNQEIAFFELEKQTLKFQNKYYSSPEYMELSARERLNLANSGEKVVILPPHTLKAIPENELSSAPVPITQRSNYEQWMYFLFGNKSTQ